jgi:hypothetical protein
MMKLMIMLIVSALMIGVNTGFAEVAPEHFFNAPENINSDPNYTPGDFELGDVYAATISYQLQKSELVEVAGATKANQLYTLGLGEVKFLSTKNESASVVGYFRNYTGVVSVTEEGPVQLEMIIDINSLDTGIPGRNKRILNLFFQSIKPEFGISRVRFNQFDLMGTSFLGLSDGNVHSIQTTGEIDLNGVTQVISASLLIAKQNDTWTVETESLITLRISDFAFGDRPYSLIKSCNHKSLGNAVQVDLKLYFR